jgi:predicted anti-sigma-YlaC factor YlaD
MKCKKIQKLILTDYTDGEMTAFDRQKVADHIRTCAKCRAFEARVKENIITPLRQTERVQPPEEVWSRIKETLQEPERESIMESITDSLKGLFIIRKPVLVAVSLLVLVLVGGIFAKTYFTERNAANTYLEEQLDFLDSLYEDNGYTDEYTGFLTEDFFL